MEIIPAIDISGGKCVRLYKGKKGTERVYYEDPLDALNFWMKKGAERLHFVDLDGAWGSDKNKKLFQEMIKKASDKVKIQIGGGIRSLEAAVELIDLGADRVIIGTLAVKNPQIINELANRVGSKHIIIAIDYKGGKISIHGWTKDTDLNPFSFAKKISSMGAGYILFSSVEADGAFTGPDLENIKRMVNTVDIPIYAAGGVRDEEDLKRLKQTEVAGVIVGKAFYEEKIDFSIIKNSKYNE
ncbi:MAG: 1-(5-phosphoribosyl)-5-[(5-phosphoribosylamino)methylideneamino]imidazole-4-carboxamide isomerase [Candidatus Lokiarchaeota archaeon]|nr:1-(5-phosphoribosyl)-5-[(5-phosphoribosylamino)methylideneamino]imidazole-4-carboxamide isomerase [Candidatus Lokiarchaeota archaeon]MBD3343192.1 1-(5-phosphoribosyl)-5-[(5-phosphoribosylamino)methylideneamino]imidazole-4-carboxamide isomerase [Candidatus Lokiarchaeota archaeon]